MDKKELLDALESRLEVKAARREEEARISGRIGWRPYSFTPLTVNSGDTITINLSAITISVT